MRLPPPHDHILLYVDVAALMAVDPIDSGPRPSTSTTIATVGSVRSANEPAKGTRRLAALGQRIAGTFREKKMRLTDSLLGLDAFLFSLTEPQRAQQDARARLPSATPRSMEHSVTIHTSLTTSVIDLSQAAVADADEPSGMRAPVVLAATALSKCIRDDYCCSDRPATHVMDAHAFTLDYGGLAAQCRRAICAAYEALAEPSLSRSYSHTSDPPLIPLGDSFTGDAPALGADSQQTPGIKVPLGLNSYHPCLDEQQAPIEHAEQEGIDEDALAFMATRVCKSLLTEHAPQMVSVTVRLHCPPPFDVDRTVIGRHARERTRTQTGTLRLI